MGRNSIAAVLGFVTGLIIVGYLLSLRVTGVTPGPTGSTAWPYISISFNRNIDWESFSRGQGILLEPPVSGQSQLAGDKVIFTPSEPLIYGRRYTATLSSPIRAAGGLPLLGEAAWSFTVSRPELVYLRQIGDQANLWIQDSANDARQITFESAVVWDYRIAPDGRGWIVSSHPSSGGSEILQYDKLGGRRLLVRCPFAHCRDGRYQPGGNLLAFERQPKDSGPESTEIWLLDLTTMATFPAIEIGALTEPALAGPIGRSPRWSHDGRYLAFYRPDLDLIIFLDMISDSPSVVPAVDANLGEWSPAENLLAYTELTFGDRQPHEHVAEDGTVISHTRPSLYHHLILSGPGADPARDLSAGSEVDEGLPAWSPDGAWLAVARTYTGAGRQIWLLAADGSQSRQMTDDPLFQHSSLSWSPDAQKIAFMRRLAGDNSAVAEIWIMELDSGEISLATSGAYYPGWKP